MSTAMGSGRARQALSSCGIPRQVPPTNSPRLRFYDLDRTRESSITARERTYCTMPCMAWASPPPLAHPLPPLNNGLSRWPNLRSPSSSYSVLVRCSFHTTPIDASSRLSGDSAWNAPSHAYWKKASKSPRRHPRPLVFPGLSSRVASRDTPSRDRASSRNSAVRMRHLKSSKRGLWYMPTIPCTRSGA